MLFIFDFDSTLAELRGVPWHTEVRKEVFEYGKTLGMELDPEMHIVPLANLVANTEERKERVDAIFRRYEKAAIGRTNFVVYDSTVPTLSALRKLGHKVAIASNNNAISIREVVEAGGIPVDAIKGRDSVFHPKPYPDMLLSLMKEFKMPKGRTFMTGDGFWDKEAGEAAGVKTFIIKPGKLDISLFKEVLSK